MMQECIPGRWLIRGVPYVPYRDAAQWSYPDRETLTFLNPSYPASMQMISRYWGDNFCDESTGKVATSEGDSWLENSPGGVGIENLKTELVRNL